MMQPIWLKWQQQRECFCDNIYTYFVWMYTRIIISDCESTDGSTVIRYYIAYYTKAHTFFTILFQYTYTTYAYIYAIIDHQHIKTHSHTNTHFCDISINPSIHPSINPSILQTKSSCIHPTRSQKHPPIRQNQRPRQRQTPLLLHLLRNR